MRPIIISDNQFITRAGIKYLIAKLKCCDIIIEATDKKSLTDALEIYKDSVVIMDYTLFDFSGLGELLILKERFMGVNWIIFSDELSESFIRTVGINSKFSILLKNCPEMAFEAAISNALGNTQFLCQQMAFIIEQTPKEKDKEIFILTPTETEILKSVASGFSVKEIANKRFTSIHTVITHKKNIFRKLEINNVHEATKYALRAGLIDSAEYLI